MDEPTDRDLITDHPFKPPVPGGLWDGLDACSHRGGDYFPDRCGYTAAEHGSSPLPLIPLPTHEEN